MSARLIRRRRGIRAVVCACGGAFLVEFIDLHRLYVARGHPTASSAGDCGVCGAPFRVSWARPRGARKAIFWLDPETPDETAARRRFWSDRRQFLHDRQQALYDEAVRHTVDKHDTPIEETP